MWCWRRMEFSWTDCENSEEVWHRVKKGRNIRHAIKRRKGNWTGEVLHRNCHLKHIFEGKIQGKVEGMLTLETRCKQLLDHLNEMRQYWKLKEEAIESHSLENLLSQKLCVDLSYDRLCAGGGDGGGGDIITVPSNGKINHEVTT
jgi:hypothetical protein